MLRAGAQFNVIPAEAEATLDVRALPDEDLNVFMAEMRKVIADDRVRVEPLSTALRIIPPSRLDTAIYSAVETVQQRMYPDITTIPQMMGGASDMPLLRARGMQCYGIGPAVDLEDVGSSYAAHADQERILERSLYEYVMFTWNVVTKISAQQ
jgi:acetylornithine deacetylase/succinyl-diaminopimelate desuccinylase-like protein